MSKQIKKILVANRGEIACRIMQTCRKLGIQTAVVFSEADEASDFVKQADEAIRIGGFQPGESYLDQDKIIAAAKAVAADAIHPGYGFLSENAIFSERCKTENIIFIGPHADAIVAMGSKIGAKAIMQKAGVPVIPGYNGDNQSVEVLAAEALKIGFPILLKASAGGGGKGMRVVRAESELLKSIDAAKRESRNAFGDDSLLIEKYFDSSRHIEIQIFGDKHHNYLHFGERECSIQRRHQKVIEESPSPILTEQKRAAMGDAAVKAAAAIQYDNAGTVEFIYTDKDEFYFLEVNTRLQVEHPVTELVTGFDLVELQIKVAQGEPIGLKQEDIRFTGHAVECRLYAEDPNNDYLPVTGKILHWNAPEIDGVRYDTGVTSNSVIDVFYDPMIAKIIAYGKNRQLAILKLEYAMKQLNVSGLTTNKSFLSAVLAHPDFKSGDFNTGFLAQKFQFNPTISSAAQNEFMVAAVAWQWAQRKTKKAFLQEVPQGWRNNFYQPQQTNFQLGDEIIIIYYTNQNNQLHLQLKDEAFTARAIDIQNQQLTAEINGIRRVFTIVEDEQNFYLHQAIIGNITLKKAPRFIEPGATAEKGGYAAPMPGQVIELSVKAGDVVKKGDTLLILLSMKMENAIEAMEDGVIEEIFVEKNAFVEADTLMLKVKTV
jgi:acetyl-CoA carboxylase biotin carboxylase subunit